MLNYLRELAGRKGKTSRGTTPRSYSRSRRGRLALELLGERILLAAGSSIPPILGPTLPGSDGLGSSAAAADNGLVPVSSYTDDPFVRPAHVAWMNLADFDRDSASDSPTRLSGPRVAVGDEDWIFRMDKNTGEFKKFAENPWPQPTANHFGNFVFDEPRFPIFNVVRGPDGKPLLDEDGLQIWEKNDLRYGMNTAFQAANWVVHTSEQWAGRPLPWGVNGQLFIEPHAFIDFNAEYSPSARMLFFGVVPYRLPGEQQIKMFETATSWDMDAHESGHAVHAVLKPNADQVDQGFNTWGESFADQMAMWSSLQDPERARALLQEVGGDLYGSNSLTRIVEAFAALVGKGTGIRDAFQDKTVSTTSDEVHDRSEVLTGAAYKVFCQIYNDLTQTGMSEFNALRKAGHIMGVFLTRAADHTPENEMTLEDVGKAYLKVDKEYFGGKYHDLLANELQRREIFHDNSLAEFDAHEAALPQLRLQDKNALAANQLIQDNLDKLDVPPGFGLQLQSYTVDALGQQIVRVQLTQGRGAGAELLDNHGILVFRRDGSLMDYHGPLASGVSSAPALQLLHRAEQLRLDQHGASLAIIQTADGQLQIEARMLQGDGIDSSFRVFSLDHPNGERRALDNSDADELKAFLPKGAVILTAEDLQAAKKTTLDAVFATPVTPADGLPVHLSSRGSSVHAEFSPSEISRSMLGGDSDFLPHRSGADTADGDAHKVVMLGSKPGGTGDGISPSGLIDRLFGSDCLGGLSAEELSSGPEQFSKS